MFWRFWRCSRNLVKVYSQLAHSSRFYIEAISISIDFAVIGSSSLSRVDQHWAHSARPPGKKRKERKNTTLLSLCLKGKLGKKLFVFKLTNSARKLKIGCIFPKSMGPNFFDSTCDSIAWLLNVSRLFPHVRIRIRLAGCTFVLRETFLHSPVVEFVIDEAHLPGMSSTELEMLAEKASWEPVVTVRYLSNDFLW